MTTMDLFNQIKAKQSFLCVGLDVDQDYFPVKIKDSPDNIFNFSKSIIDTTAKYCVAYKINIAFFEAYGIEGWNSLEKVMDYLNNYYPEIFTIADAKRADIGNTSKRYAKAYFDHFDFDSITVAPYMGADSVEPFLTYKNKHTILLALTSNIGAADFQLLHSGNDMLYERVIKTSLAWQNSNQLMFVVGATKAEALITIRKLIPEHFLLIPGIGAQGGSLEEVAKNGLNHQCGLLVNSSRAIIYASKEMDYAEKAGLAAKKIQEKMKELLIQNHII
ncbi:MAG: orotidine-5'-phosphate decarboxylase [Flavobacteriaceae bacterium]|tara:strand:+ start:5984 stop:6811 length:828 start_codon:yes stop_codon:yes gene_type:complete